MSTTAAPSRRPASSQAVLSQPAGAYADPFEPEPVQPSPAGAAQPGADSGSFAEAPILFQDYFKSAGPRTYAAQVKRAKNENHFLLVTEGRRDAKTGDVRKTKLLVFSEDFEAFFNMVNQAAAFIRANPVPAHVAQRQKKFWSKKGTPGSGQ